MKQATVIMIYNQSEIKHKIKMCKVSGKQPNEWKLRITVEEDTIQEIRNCYYLKEHLKKHIKDQQCTCLKQNHIFILYNSEGFA